MNTDYDDFFVALDEAISRAGNANRLAKLSGVPVQSLSRWKSRDRSPSLEAIIPLLPFMDWPKHPHGSVITRLTGNSMPEEVEGKNLCRIPVVGEAGAGNPVDVFNGEDTDEYIEVLPSYYSKEMRGLVVTGDSMEPTIHKGAIVGVEPYSGELEEGSVYLCRIPYFGMLVKRVRADGLNGLLLVSDNKEYSPVKVPLDECPNLIIGKVLWCLQKV